MPLEMSPRCFFSGFFFGIVVATFLWEVGIAFFLVEYSDALGQRAKRAVGEGP